KHLKERAGPRLELLAGRTVGAQRGTGKKQRALLAESDGINRRDSSARSSKQDHHSARPQDVQSFYKSGLAHRVIDHVHTFALGQTLGLTFKITLGIQDDFVRAGLARQLGL